MRDHALFDKIDLHLIRVLHTVLTERSVSKAALRLGMHQPAVSNALKRLRDFAGDPLLVRSGPGMVPTDAGLRMIEPSASILRAAEMLFDDVRGFEAPTARNTFRIAASDYLDPEFLPRLVAAIKAHGHRDARILSAPDQLAPIIRDLAKPGDYIVCLGAGNITQWAYALPGELEALETK